MIRRVVIAQHSLAPTLSAVHLNISLYSHILRVGICQYQVNHQATTQPLPPASPFVLSRQQATPAVHYGFFPGTQLALLAVLAQPLLPNPWQLFQIVSTFLSAATASHPPHSCSVDDSHLCSWAWLSKHSSHTNPSAHLSKVPSKIAHTGHAVGTSAHSIK